MKMAQIILDHPTFKGSMIGFFRNYIPEYDFDFYVIDKNPKPILNGYLSEIKPEVVFKRTNSDKEERDFINEILDKYDIVIFHSMMLSPGTKSYILFHNKQYIRKIVWIEWGYDLYLTHGKGITDLVRFIVKKMMVYLFDRKIPYFIAIHPSDMDEYKRIIKGNAYLNWVPYLEKPNPSTPCPKNSRKLMRDKIEAGKPITIQIGQRAWKGLNHLYWLKRLAVYKNENIRILLPLSYGDMEYGDKVQAEAEEIFRDKVIVLRDVMPLEEYRALLADVDIFVLDSRRQIALGNIHTMLRNQKKIYMPCDSSLYTYFRSQGIHICNIKEIGAVSFSTLTEDLDMDSAIQFMNHYDTIDNVTRWREILSDVINPFIGEKL